MLTVTVGKGRRKKTLKFPMLNRQILSCMTERTQIDTFGEVVQPRTNTSVHGKVVIGA